MRPRVVLIDSGLHTSHPHLREHAQHLSSQELTSKGCFESAGLDNDALGHGTAAAAAILDLAPGIELISLRVFTNGPECPLEDVLKALDHAASLDAALINLSLGSTKLSASASFSERLQQLAARGTRLVSPAVYRGLPSYPGALVGCLGVMMDASLKRDVPEQRSSGERSYWFASPYPRELPGLPRDSNLVGVSMACANLTGVLARRPG